ncbi:glycosyltransferase family 9 protein [Fulvivirga lutea]|uniref:Glycosyltransferase family 9 protein n=1 Tax=Fulvivirga lutea TaxID=2810512 RepID=A0A974WE71_9BACT|nr:glycosyltransferase family 9 protein [Fulvivirga lutea]QSE96376.1 glycosyltransferase family 9 protein [Fulvivirga lutea]
MNKILVIQTAFLGDVVLATALVEKIKAQLPNVELHFLLRKGNEAVLKNHPKIDRLWILDKGQKWASTRSLISSFRKEKFDLAINLQRFLSSGVITVLSGAKRTIGFKKNPMSFLFSESFDHIIESSGSDHEVMRNQRMIESFTDSKPVRPRLYPSADDYKSVEVYQTKEYITVAPASVWFTKQFPAHKWIELLNSLKEGLQVYLIGAPSDKELCNQILEATTNTSVINLAGQLKPLASVALIEKAKMNYVNDSAPLHFASAVNAPVTAVFCSTVPGFGFGPLSDDTRIVEVKEDLSCRPCGLHGYRKCPKGHFKCAENISIDQLAMK